MSGDNFSARKVGRQWQIWRGETFYCLATRGRHDTRAARTREDAARHAARLEARETEARAWSETVTAARLANALAYLERRAARPRELALI